MRRVLSGTTCMGDTEKMDDAGKEKERNDIMKSLLVVVDMQKDFIDGSLGTREAQKIVKNVAEKIQSAEAAGTQVVFTYDTHPENYLETQEGKRLLCRDFMEKYLKNRPSEAKHLPAGRKKKALSRWNWLAFVRISA